MDESIKVHQKKRGRPATGRDPLISARIPQEAIDALEALAAREGETRSTIVRRAILDWLKAHGPVSSG
jgi:hypothetical protein